MRTITATTTDEQILAPIQTAKDSLVIEATEAASSEYLKGKSLVGLAQEVRNAEDLAVAQLSYRGLLANGVNEIERLTYLLRLLTRQDDTWSGRGNDSTRSAQDAVAAWASREADTIRYANR